MPNILTSGSFGEILFLKVFKWTHVKGGNSKAIWTVAQSTGFLTKGAAGFADPGGPEPSILQFASAHTLTTTAGNPASSCPSSDPVEKIKLNQIKYITTGRSFPFRLFE